MFMSAAADPLVIVLGVFAAALVASRLLFKRYPPGRAAVRVVFLVLLTAALLHADIVPYRPLEPTGVPLLDVVHAILKIAWWVWAAWFLVGVARATLIVEQRPHEGRLLQDLTAGLIYLAALFAIVAYVFDLPVSGLLATSGAIAVILGLALQSTLGDVFSGIVLNFSRPYRPGDWINIGGDTTGRVIETNWRATLILTAQRDLAIIPNSTISKSKIVNVSSPSGIHGVTIGLQVGAKASPSAVAELLHRALINSRLVLENPAPSVTVKSMNAAYFEFAIDFFVEQMSAMTQAQNELLDLVYRHLATAGIDLAPPANAAAPAGQAARESPTLQESVLAQVAAFATLTPAERAAVAAKLKRRPYDQGAVIVGPGVVLQMLCIVGSGVLSVSREDGGFDEEVSRLGPGEHFGEISVLAGAATVGRVTALTSAVIYELPKEALTRVLATFPEVAQAFNRTLARQRAILARPAPTEPENAAPPHSLTSWVVDWLHRRYDVAMPK